jgi:hypothetical protein
VKLAVRYGNAEKKNPAALCWDFFVGDFILSIFRMEEQWYNLNNLIEEGGDAYDRANLFGY